MGSDPGAGGGPRPVGFLSGHLFPILTRSLSVCGMGADTFEKLSELACMMKGVRLPFGGLQASRRPFHAKPFFTRRLP